MPQLVFIGKIVKDMNGEPRKSSEKWITLKTISDKVLKFIRVPLLLSVLLS